MLGRHEVTTDEHVPSGAETTVGPVPLQAGQVTFHSPTVAPQLVERRGPAGHVPVVDVATGHAATRLLTAVPGDHPPDSAALHEALSDADNRPEWESLEATHPILERIELFDMIRWAFLREATAR